MTEVNRETTAKPEAPTPPDLSPAPWRVSSARLGTSGPYYEVLDADGRPVCGFKTAKGSETARANATATAAVPLMLAALIEAERIMSRNVYPCPDKPQSAWGVLCRVREAIQAATNPEPTT